MRVHRCLGNLHVSYGNQRRPEKTKTCIIPSVTKSRVMTTPPPPPPPLDCIQASKGHFAHIRCPLGKKIMYIHTYIHIYIYVYIYVYIYINLY